MNPEPVGGLVEVLWADINTELETTELESMLHTIRTQGNLMSSNLIYYVN